MLSQLTRNRVTRDDMQSGIAEGKVQTAPFTTLA